MQTRGFETETALLCEALGVPAGTVSFRSREPLSTGSVTGFDVTGDDGAHVYYLDTSALPVAQETGLALHEEGSDAVTARIWLHPADPHLPALAPVAFDHAAEALLARLGIAQTAFPEMRAYRPGRRAVLRIATTEGAVWVKVVRPSRTSRIVSAHAAFHAAGVPGPAVRGWAPEGIIILDEATGTPAPDVAWEPERLLDEVDGVRERIGAVNLDVPVRGVATRLDWYAARAGVTATSLVSGIRSLTAERDAGPRGVVHGDLHFGQMFLDDAHRLSAVIDVDTAGHGLLAEDPAAFLAHAAASATLTHGGSERRVWALADGAMQRWGDDPGVRALTATHLLGHALGAADSGGGDRAARLLRVAEAILRGEAPSVGENPDAQP